MVKANRESPDLSLVEKSYDHVNTAMEELRKLSHSLVSPTLKEIGLRESLKGFIQELNMTHEFKVQLIYKINQARTLDHKLELALYRIIQEQMNNIVKYAKANTIIIHLREKDQQLDLSILDDGVGFDTTKKVNGIGLRNIQSRVDIFSGSMDILSSPGDGCRLEVRIPL